MPNYARPVFSPVPKDPPHRLEQEDAKAKIGTTDKKEREKCHVRSKGQCEVREVITPLFVFDKTTMRQKPVTKVVVRCKRRVSENHHLLGGIGRRNRGRSILAEHRLDTCAKCHKDLTGNVLVPINGTKKDLAGTVLYERVRLPKKRKSQQEDRHMTKDETTDETTPQDPPAPSAQADGDGTTEAPAAETAAAEESE